MSERQLYAENALLPSGWAQGVVITVDRHGTISAVCTGQEAPAAARVLPGPVLPGMVNSHSHAFQRAMAGLAEYAGARQDSFWTWREQMYALVTRLTPGQVEAIARYLYIEMLKAGYTAVAEFHYLHNDRQGQPYEPPAEMGSRLLTAAAQAGLPVTLMPTLYSYGGFGSQPLAPGQRRFSHDTDRFLQLIDTLEAQLGAGQYLGIAFHSLRAVTMPQIEQVLTTRPGHYPVHIHVAEQQREVDDCVAWSGQRPVAYLLDQAPVDARWCLIHATHISDEECRALARSEACVGLCPTTEANLGDGLFPGRDFIDADGLFAIGSDSHVSVSVLEELRSLEYGQRLFSEKRNRLHDGGDVGAYLYRQAAENGARAAQQPTGALRAGTRADFVILDGAHPLLATCAPARLASRWLFAGDSCWVREVWIAGHRVVQDGRHPQEVAAGRGFIEAVGSC